MKQIHIAFKLKGRPIKFSVMSDLGEQAETAVFSWVNRTTTFTAESFCTYVNNKGVHKCKTIKE